MNVHRRELQSIFLIPHIHARVNFALSELYGYEEGFHIILPKLWGLLEAVQLLQEQPRAIGVL